MIKINNLSKRYKNKFLALDEISLEVKPGTVLGVLGPNGSGKTTLLKLLQGYLKPTSGSIEIFGNSIGAETKRMVSYLPDTPFIPKDYKIEEAMNLWKMFFEDFNTRKFNDLLKFMNLDLDMKVGELSKGMSEKLHLSLILGRDAEIYIIDEPIAGVDLVARDAILEAILENIGEDKILIITTHLVDELEKLLDRVVFISEGKILLEGDAEELRVEKEKSIADIYREIFGKVSL